MLARCCFALAAFGALCLGSSNAQQQPRHVGVILVGVGLDSKETQAFRQGMQDAGYVEGRDVVIHWHPADGDYSRIPPMAADLVRRKVDVVVVDSTIGVRTVKRQASTIPIVMAVVADPVGSGLVSNLARPGENVTGLSQMIPDLSVKHLELLKETIPKLSRVAVLWNSETPYHTKVLEELKAAAPSLSLDLTLINAPKPAQIVPAFAAAKRARAQALYVLGDPQFLVNRKTIIEQAAKAKLPTIYGTRQFVQEGGLISYGTNLSDLFRRSAGYVDKILKGAKPGDLPVEQPTKFELLVNLKSAKALGLTLPQSILQRADEVIQ